jgi:hypothetical protein
MPRSGAVTLSDVDQQFLTIACEPCKRRGQYSLAKLWAKHGDAGLPDLLNLLSADCPRRMANSMTDRCRASFEWPNGAPSGKERP